MIDYAILSLLCGRNGHGYEIKRRFDEALGPIWCLNVGQVYQALRSLEARGLIREQADPEVPGGRGGPGRNRRTYGITPKGERALERWLRRAPTRTPPLRDEILVRLLVARATGEEAAVAQIEASERAHRGRLARAREEAARKRGEDALLAQLGLSAEIAHLEARLAWLGLCRDRLAARRSPPRRRPATVTRSPAPARAAG